MNRGMNKFLQKPFRWAMVFSIILTMSTSYVLLDTFVIPRAEAAVSLSSSTTASAAATTVAGTDSTTAANSTSAAAATSVTSVVSGNSNASISTTPIVTSNSYKDANIQITIETVRKYNTNIYIADIQVSSAEYLKTAFAQGTYGRNIKEVTSSIAANNNAIFAINGDYYGFRNYGFVLRNGVLYRSTAKSSGNDESLVIDSLGNFSIINESQTSAQSLVDANVWQVLSFGPALVNDGNITVTANSEVGQSMSSNPRTAIGQVSALHYIVIVSDGRTSENAGLSLLELAQVFADRDCTVAYNLDGGGSSTMWFNGQVVNNPTDGRSFSERSVSDIVYFGY
jgi:exopolysaccharide biosynthesis protein